jgi:hypothetical protein
MSKALQLIETGIHLIEGGKYRARVDRGGTPLVAVRPTLALAQEWRAATIKNFPAGKPTGIRSGESIHDYQPQVGEETNYDWKKIIKRYNLAPDEIRRIRMIGQFLKNNRGQTFVSDEIGKRLAMRQEDVMEALKVLIHLNCIIRLKNGFQCEALPK